jgi:pilus assembly protein CpaF
MIDKELMLKMRNHLISGFDLSMDITDEKIEELIDEEIIKEGHLQYISINDRLIYKRVLFNSIRGLDVLQDLADDPTITEIMVNGINNIFIEQKGHIKRSEIEFYTSEKLMDVIQQIASISNRRVNEASPIVDARLADGSRVNIVLPPVALDGPVVTIRKFPSHGITMSDLIDMGSISKVAAHFLEILVKSGYNIFVSGGTGSGKTTFLNVLSGFIPKDSRVITIEDSAELRLHHINNLVRLEVRQDNVEGHGGISIRDLIKTSLRMRPDRIIVGEVRGGEAIDMLQAMNTGHDGSMSTGHANSSIDMLIRLETMVLMGAPLPISAIRGQIAAGIDIIVHLGRLRDKSRKVLEISEVKDFNGTNIILNPLFTFLEEAFVNEKVVGSLKSTGNTLSHKGKLELSGYQEPDYE